MLFERVDTHTCLLMAIATQPENIEATIALLGTSSRTARLIIEGA